MADRKTVKLPEDDYERHNERRQKMGLTWAEYIDGQAPDLEETIREAVRAEVNGDGCRLMECPQDATHGVLYKPEGMQPIVEKYCQRHAELAAEDAENEPHGRLLDGPAPVEELGEP